MYDRRRLLLSDLEKGRIIIIAADETNYVKVGDVTYTAPIIIPIKEEILTAMKTSKGGFFTWQVEPGKALELQTDMDDPLAVSHVAATFTALPGYTYVIDATEHSIVVTRPKKWDGFIFASDKPHYPYAPLYAVKGVERNYVDGKYYMRFYYNGSTGTHGGGISFYPIDLTRFSSVHGRSSRLDNAGWQTFDFCICPEPHGVGTINQYPLMELTYTDGEDDDELSTNSFTASLKGASGEWCVTWDNGLADYGTTIEELWFIK